MTTHRREHRVDWGWVGGLAFVLCVLAGAVGGALSLDYETTRPPQVDGTFSVAEPERPTVTMLHASLQFSDPLAQRKADANAVLAWGADAVTGTEAAQADTRRVLRAAAKRHDYRIAFGGDSWVAVSRDFISGRSDGKAWRAGYEKVIDGGGGKGYSDKGIVGATVSTEHGRMSFLTTHYLTARTPGSEAANRRLAARVVYWAQYGSKGNPRVFYGGDQNLNDERVNTFFDERVVSAGDHLGKWPGTGHGPIDVLAFTRRDVPYPLAYWLPPIKTYSDHKPIAVRWGL